MTTKEFIEILVDDEEMLEEAMREYFDTDSLWDMFIRDIKNGHTAANNFLENLKNNYEENR